jgi:hypothetical protein
MAHVMPLADSRQRAELAYQLRSIGRSWRQIRDELGYKSVGAVTSAYERHEARMGTDAPERWRAQLVESNRLTSSVLFDRFAVAADRGDDRTLALLNGELHKNRDQMAKLVGAYMPAKAELDLRSDPSSVVGDFFTALLAGQRPGVPPRSALSAQAPIEAEVVDE